MVSTRYRFPQQATTCPVCHRKSAIILESRETKNWTRRRRKGCTECDHRFTVYEVSEEFYKTAVENQRKLDSVVKSLNLHNVSPEQHVSDVYSCDDCAYMRSGECGFEFPDAGGAFANECSMFEPNEN